jgi:SAM-dependent MidA family methyltransferase
VLVVDYALDNRRYNAAIRAVGTLIAYRQQRASGDLLQDPGHWDLTAHLCLEPLEADARASGWQPLGQRRQGEALLALGLAQRLHGLQSSRPDQLAAALASREALLRLVDPGGLGAFQWIAFGRPGDHPVTDSLFLADPPDQGGCG